MSKADIIFRDMCKDIIENGTTTEGQKVRPVWEDGTPAYTIKKFGVVNRYDLREEFPAITFRRTALKSAMDEILWIYQKKSNNINNLNSHIWDEWADKTGSIGKAYGYQIAQEFLHHKDKFGPYNSKEEMIKDERLLTLAKEKGYSDIESFMKANYPVEPNINGIQIVNSYYMDQMNAVLYDLKNTPFSRRIITNMYNISELHAMNLHPCAYSCTFNVTDEGGDKLVLNMVLNQRSQDVLAANNWNVVQYAILLMMIAQVSGMEAGVLLHVIADAHIYDRHVDIIKELITRESYPAPIVALDPDITDFYDFTTNSLRVENYKFGPQVENIPIAI